MTSDYFVHQRNALLRWHVWQSNQSAMGNIVHKNQFSEVSIYRNQDPVLRFRQFQQASIARVRAERLGFQHVMSVIAKPFRQSASSAPVYQELHSSATETAASVSRAMIACA